MHDSVLVQEPFYLSNITLASKFLYWPGYEQMDQRSPVQQFSLDIFHGRQHTTELPIFHVKGDVVDRPDCATGACIVLKSTIQRTDSHFILETCSKR